MCIRDRYDEYQIAVQIDDSLQIHLEESAATLRDAGELMTLVDRILVSPITDALLSTGCDKEVLLTWDGEETKIVSTEG